VDRHVLTRSSRRWCFGRLCINRSVGSACDERRNKRADLPSVNFRVLGRVDDRSTLFHLGQPEGKRFKADLDMCNSSKKFAKGRRTKGRIRLRLDRYRVGSSSLVRADAHGRGSSHIIHWTMFRLVRFTFELGHRECLLMCDRSGPMFPIMLSVARHSIPHEIASGSVAWIQRYAGSCSHCFRPTVARR
jgi:hypothetical protein